MRQLIDPKYASAKHYESKSRKVWELCIVDSNLSFKRNVLMVLNVGLVSEADRTFP